MGTFASINILLTGHTQRVFQGSGFPVLPESTVCFHPGTASRIKIRETIFDLSFKAQLRCHQWLNP